MSLKSKFVAVAAGLIIAAFGVQTAQAAEVPGPTGSRPLSQATVDRLMAQPGPKYAILDADTGKFLSITNAVDAKLLAGPENRPFCDPADGCFFSGQTPWAHQGFRGLPGTVYGNWPYRSGFKSGGYTVKACWVGGCSPVTRPNVTVNFAAGQRPTGSSFTLY